MSLIRLTTAVRVEKSVTELREFTLVPRGGASNCTLLEYYVQGSSVTCLLSGICATVGTQQAEFNVQERACTLCMAQGCVVCTGRNRDCSCGSRVRKTGVGASCFLSWNWYCRFHWKLHNLVPYWKVNLVWTSAWNKWWNIV